MLNKKLMILAIFFVSLLALSAVSAADNVTDDVVSVKNMNEDVSVVEKGVDETMVLGENQSEDIMSMETSEDAICVEQVDTDVNKVMWNNENQQIDNEKNRSYNDKDNISFEIDSRNSYNLNEQKGVLSSIENNVISFNENEDILGSSPPYYAYSCTLYDVSIWSGDNQGSILPFSMSYASSSSSYTNKFDFYLKVYDSNGKEKISQRYYGGYNSLPPSMSVDATKLSLGKYTMKIINYVDNKVMSTSNLYIVNIPHDKYTIRLSNSTIVSQKGGSVLYGASYSSSSPYTYKYDFYLKVYDSNGNEKISQRYYNTENNFPEFKIDANQLNPGRYTVKIVTNIDNYLMSTANLYVVNLEHYDYRVKVSNSTIISDEGGKIKIDISHASSSYDYRYDFYLKVYDSKGNEKISQRYFSTDAYSFIYSFSSVAQNISANQLTPGIYTIKLLNNIDDYVMSTANLYVVSVPHNAYSVSTNDTVFICGLNESIVMNIAPANSSYNYKYDYYLEVYDSNGAQKISQRYSSLSTNYQENHSFSSYQLKPGNYTIKLFNNIDNYLMDTSNLTVISIPYNTYSVTVNNTTLIYGNMGNIVMNIAPFNLSNGYKYDYYLKVYDSNGNEKISERFCSSNSSSQETYNFSKYQLSTGIYKIKILNSNDEYVMFTANLTVIPVPHTAYSVNVSNITITYQTSGSIIMNITPSNSSYYYKYDYYLKVYDSNGNQKISQRYYSASPNSQETYSVSSTQLNPGIYTIKLLNNVDDYEMASANLSVIALTYNSYSVNVSDTIIIYNKQLSIVMNVTPFSDTFSNKYDFYLNVYDSNGDQKISQRYRGSNSDPIFQITYWGSSNWDSGNYSVKILNSYDNNVMSTANLYIITVPHDAYSVSVSGNTVTYGANDYITMKINHASDSYNNYRYDFYLKVYDSNGTEKISQRYYTSYSYSSTNTSNVYYNVGSNLVPGIYKIKILNNGDNYVMGTANLKVIALTSTSYSVYIPNITLTYGVGGNIKINIHPASSTYSKRYDFYLKVYDSNGNEKISQRYYSSSYNSQETYSVSANKLSPGNYTIKILNYYDNNVMRVANLTVLALTSDVYSVNVSDTTLTYGIGGNIVMNITPASSQYYNKYDFYLKVYDSNGNQKISQRYYSTTSSSEITYSVSSNKLSPGNYTIKILNYYDNNVMRVANLTVLALTSDVYSVNVSDTTLTYGIGGNIVMNITPASSQYYNKYDFYLKVYDSNGNQKISQRYYSASPNSQETYSVSSTQLDPGIYTIKIVNYYDNTIMNTTNLTLISVPYNRYSANVSDIRMYYGTSGVISMYILPASSYYYKYDFYLKVYDSNGAEKISQRYYSASSSSQRTYSVGSTQLNPGIYTIKLLNNVDNYLMDNSKLYVIDSPNLEIYSRNFFVDEIVNVNYTIVSSATGILSVYINDTFIKNVSVGSKIELGRLNEGKYSIKIIYNGEGYYETCQDIATIEVKKHNTNLNISSKDIYVENIAKINYTITNGTLGVLSIYLNDTFIKNVSVGKNIELKGLQYGNYVVKVIYNGDDKYVPCQNTTEFEVRRLTPTFSFSKNNAIAGEDFEITYILNSDATGTITCNNSTKRLINGRVNFVINNIKGGSHQFYISYSGDDKYNPMNKTVNANIKFKDAIVDFDVKDIIWSDSLTIAPTLTTGATGYLSIYIDNNLNSTININGRKDFTFYVGGYHYIKVTYSGDDFYASNSTTKGFNVIKLNSTCDIKGNIEIDNSATVYVTLNEDATGKVSISIEGTKYTSNLVDGVATFRVPNLPASTYDVFINYEGDSKYNLIHITKSLEVTLKQSTIDLNVNNVLNGSNVVIRPIVTQGATGNLKIYIDGALKSTIAIGSSYTVTSPLIGPHNVRVVYKGDSYHKGNETKTTFRVFTFYPIKVQNSAIIYGTDKHFQAIFYDEYGNVAANKLVAFNLNGEDTVVMTDINGLAVFNKDLPLGTYTVTVINAYVNEKHDYQLKVFTSIESEDMTRAYNTGIDFKVKLLDENGDTLSKGYALFNVNNKDYPVVADNNGIAVLNANLPVGTYTVTTTNGRTGETKTNKITIVPSVEATNMVRGYNSGVDFKAKFLDADAKPLINQKVAFKIGSIEYEATTDVNGFAVLNEQLDVGKYEVTVINKVTGEKAIRNLTIVDRIVENNDVIRIYGEESYYTIRVVGDDGNFVGENEVVNININNIDYQIRTNNNGYASFRIDENIGSYNIFAEYKGYGIYNKVYVLGKVYYIKNLDVANIDYKQNAIVNLNLSSFDNNAYVEFEIVGDNGYNKIFRQSAANSISLPVTGLDAGKYTVTARYYDLNTLKFSSMVKAFNVNKINPKIIVVVEDANVGETATITVNIPDVEGNVEIKVGNALSFNEYLVKNGVIIKEIDSLPMGTYNIDVTYVGDNNYNRFTQSATLTIIQPKLLTKISATGVTLNYGKGTDLVATLKDELGNVLIGKGMSIYFNGINSIVTTDKNGQVKLTIKNNLVPKTYSTIITFVGDDYYVGSKINVNVKVNKVTPKLTATKKTFKKSVKTKKYTITLKNNLNKPMKSTWITLKVNKKTLKAKTNSKGKATFKITNLKKKGKVTATVIYKGNKYYNKLKKKVKITVK